MRSSRRRASASPPRGGGEHLLLETERRRATGSVPSRGPAAAAATRAARRARSPRGSPSQARWKGEKTVYGLPAWVRSPPTSSTALRPGCAWSVDAGSPRLTRSPRRRANGLTSALKWSSSAPISAASAASSRSGGPWRITSPPPRSRSEPSRSPGTRAGTACGARRRGGRAAAGRRGRRPARRARGVERAAQRRVVVHAQVAPVPDDRGHLSGYGADGDPGSKPARTSGSGPDGEDRADHRRQPRDRPRDAEALAREPLGRLLLGARSRTRRSRRRRRPAARPRSAWCTWISPRSESIERSCAQLPSWEIDLLVNNAGLMTGGLLEEQELDDIYAMFQVNLVAVATSRGPCCPGCSSAAAARS